MAGVGLALLAACGGSEGNEVAADIEAQTAGEAAPVPEVTGVPQSTTTTRPDRSGENRPTTTRPTTDTGEPATDEERGDDPLKRRDAPPSGVASHLTFSAFAPFPCVPDAAPVLQMRSDTYPTGVDVYIGTCGFDHTSPVSFEISMPDGQTSVSTVTAVPRGDYWSIGMQLRAGPTGFYNVTAVQGTTREERGFTVVPDVPRIVSTDPKAGPPGTTFRFEVESPFSYEPVVLDLYEREIGYLATLLSTTTDHEGKAMHELRTQSDSPAGNYCVAIRPWDGICASFVVR